MYYSPMKWKTVSPQKIIFGVMAAALPAIGNVVDYEARTAAMEEWKEFRPTMPTGVLACAATRPKRWSVDACFTFDQGGNQINQ